MQSDRHTYTHTPHINTFIIEFSIVTMSKRFECIELRTRWRRSIYIEMLNWLDVDFWKLMHTIRATVWAQQQLAERIWKKKPGDALRNDMRFELYIFISMYSVDVHICRVGILLCWFMMIESIFHSKWNSIALKKKKVDQFDEYQCRFRCSSDFNSSS